MNEFYDKYFDLSDEQLLGILAKREEYQQEAAEAAIRIAKERGIIDENLTPLQETLDRIEEEKKEEEEENLEHTNEHLNNAKQRHGCVTAWLILMIVVNSLMAIFFTLLYVSEDFAGDDSVLFINVMLFIANIVFVIMLLQWKKLGFYGFFMTSMVTLVINIIITGLSMHALAGLVSIAILYGILQIKKGGITAWENLE